MKTIINTALGAVLLGLVACGPSAEQVEQQTQDSIRIADSIQASIIAAEVEAMRIQDSIAIAEAAPVDTTVVVQ
ncbi:MAG: hypothetical protein H0V01_01955 [Bacteroidetes bacterium]|nr:hypothetical protein [Bacteroidota bacterium]HET6243307.1 hypothetical protein [Bacteroidia bacterium]